MIKNGWKKGLYIASRKSIHTDKYGNDRVTYDAPVKYMMNYQPVNGELDIALYGERVTSMYKAVIPYFWFKDKFKEGDVAYLNGAEPIKEKRNGNNANYVVTSVMPQNKVIILYFEKIIK